MHLVVFDIETTGFSPRYHEIIQIAAVRVRRGDVCEREKFATFVRPQKSIPRHITEITGIDDRCVRDAADPAACLCAFSRFAADATLVAHNGHRFDIPFLRQQTALHGIAARDVPYFDSMDLSRRVWPDAPSHNLDAVIERLGLSTAGLHRHDARADVHLLAEAVCLMCLRLGAPLDRNPVPAEIGQLPA